VLEVLLDEMSKKDEILMKQVKKIPALDNR